MHKLFFFFLLFTNTLLTQSQVKAQDSLANELVAKHKKLNAAHQSMLGYRIQLYFGSDRNRAIEMKTEFNQIYPKTNAYILYHQPNFKLRVGDFKQRLEAMKFFKEIQPEYNSAFIVQDEVRLPEE